MDLCQRFLHCQIATDGYHRTPRPELAAVQGFNIGQIKMPETVHITARTMSISMIRIQCAGGGLRGTNARFLLCFSGRGNRIRFQDSKAFFIPARHQRRFGQGLNAFRQRFLQRGHGNGQTIPVRIRPKPDGLGIK